MQMRIEEYKQDSTKVIRLTGAHLEVEVAPEIGGRITNIRSLKAGHQFLWKNPALSLEKRPDGSAYDPNFYGGIDELIPNDMPEDLDGVFLPDHGELWTHALDCEVLENGLSLSGTLPLCGLQYRRSIILCEDAPGIALEYTITNPTAEVKKFLWKFHAALAIEPGDEILCPAKTAKVADPAYSRWTDFRPFHWPEIEGARADLIPPKDGTTDFLYLSELTEGYMGWRRGDELAFLYRFDPAVFPYCWYFASYGGFLGHYTAVLEPCTAMPMSVKEAAALQQCSVLKAGETLTTTVHIYAGTGEQLKKYV